LDSKVFDIVDARCNHEDRYMSSSPQSVATLNFRVTWKLVK